MDQVKYNQITSTLTEQTKGVDFTQAGFDIITSDFLNKCLEHRDNLEFIFQCKTLEKISQQSVLHHDAFKVVQEIDSVIKQRKI